MTVYLAHPIDHTNGNKVKQHLPKIAQACKDAGASGVFIPGEAWHFIDTSTAQQVQHANLDVITYSDVLVAYWPLGVETVGVPLEVAHAHHRSVPIVIIRGDGTTPLSLAPFNPTMVPEEDILECCELLTSAVKQAIAPHHGLPFWDGRMEAKYNGDGAQPEAALPGDAGFDIAYHGDTDITIWPNEVARVPSGICYQMPTGYWSLILGRSSTFSKRNLFVPPSVIDAGYTGDIFAICWNIGNTAEVIKPGDRLAQIIPMPLSAEFMQWIKAPLEETARGAAGFGSTGS